MINISWIKIKTDIFDNHKIKLIERLPEGDTMLVIWLKLLTMAGKRNDSGLIYITRDIPFTPDTLSDVLGRDNKIVMLALNTFVSFEMIEIENNIIKIMGWEEHQNFAGLEKIKEQNRLRVAKYRQCKELTNSNVTVTLRNAIEENRIEKNREDKNNIIQNNDCMDIYNIYPSKCLISNRSTSKTKSNLKKINQLVTQYGKDKLTSIITRYISECEQNKTFIKNFSTFLNNLPDYDQEEPKKQNDKVKCKIHGNYLSSLNALDDTLPKDYCQNCMKRYDLETWDVIYDEKEELRKEAKK